MTRRLLLPFAAGLLATSLAAVLAADGPSSADAGKPALKLGLEAWTFRRYTFAETLDRAEALGIHYLQASPRQNLGGGLMGKFDFHMPESTRARILSMLRAKHVELVSFGVINGKNEQEWRQIFEFAKAMGMQDITSEPAPEALPVVDRLSREFRITVSLHNHPPPSRYANLGTALEAIKPYGPNIGICADTGHWVRSGYDAVENLRRAQGRILAVHFKDLNARGVIAAYDVPWGTGVSDAAGQIAELRRQNFSGVVFIEYEHDTPALMDDVARSIQFFQQETAKD